MLEETENYRSNMLKSNCRSRDFLAKDSEDNGNNENMCHMLRINADNSSWKALMIKQYSLTIIACHNAGVV